MFYGTLANQDEYFHPRYNLDNYQKIAIMRLEQEKFFLLKGKTSDNTIKTGKITK